MRRNDNDNRLRLRNNHLQHLIGNYEIHMNGLEVDPYEYSLDIKDGKKLDVIITTKLIDYGGEKAILGEITDITDCKRAEDRLRESEEKLTRSKKMESLPFFGGGNRIRIGE